MRRLNRLLTDAISNYLFTTEPSSRKNLLNEGVSEEKIYMVGNIMIDTLIKNKEKAESSNILNTLNLSPKGYCVLTLHRPSNVDSEQGLSHLLDILKGIQSNLEIVFPVHPRTRERIEEFNLEDEIKQIPNLKMVAPMGYLDFMKLMIEARFVLTDSGGIQEETTFLGIPCLTLRNNTERPITAEIGTNVVVSCDKEKILEGVRKILNNESQKGRIPDLWDGHTAERIAKIIRRENQRL